MPLLVLLSTKNFGERCPWREHPGGHAREGGIRADRRVHERALVDGGQDGAPDGRVVEGGMQGVEAQHAEIAGGVDELHRDLPVAPQHRQ